MVLRELDTVMQPSQGSTMGDHMHATGLTSRATGTESGVRWGIRVLALHTASSVSFPTDKLRAQRKPCAQS